MPQQITSWRPLASMAQKKAELPPKEAAMGPGDPNPDPGLDKNRRSERTRRKRWVSIGGEVHELKEKSGHKLTFLTVVRNRERGWRPYG